MRALYIKTAYSNTRFSARILCSLGKEIAKSGLAMPDDISAQLICPRCSLPLKKVQTPGRTLWACDGCGGRAITLELLRHTFTSESINPLWLHAIRGEGTKAGPCPSCRNPMIDVQLSENAKVDVDVCRICHMVWFDAHEMDSLAALPAPAPADNLTQEARELIAMEKIKALAEQARGPDFDSEPPDEWWKWIAGVCGMPVEFDAPAETLRPWITWFLCLLMIGITAFAFPHLQEIVQRFGLIPAQATRLKGFTFLSSFFLHAGAIHLIGNLYFLFVFGDNVEDFLGRFRYLGLIALAAFVGDVAHIAIDPRSEVPSIGASGGIAGVITFYALQFPRVRLEFFVRWGLVFFRWVRMPAWFALLLWILFQFVGAWEQVAGVSSVSALAHLGGAAVGFVTWLFWRRSNTATE